jgi:hypothetical protein
MPRLLWMRLTGCVCVQHLTLLSRWIDAMCKLAANVDQKIVSSFATLPSLRALIDDVTPYSFLPPSFLSPRGEESATHGSISCRIKSKVVPISFSLSLWRGSGLTLLRVCRSCRSRTSPWGLWRGLSPSPKCALRIPSWLQRVCFVTSLTHTRPRSRCSLARKCLALIRVGRTWQACSVWLGRFDAAALYCFVTAHSTSWNIT